MNVLSWNIQQSLAGERAGNRSSNPGCARLIKANKITINAEFLISVRSLDKLKYKLKLHIAVMNWSDRWFMMDSIPLVEAIEKTVICILIVGFTQ